MTYQPRDPILVPWCGYRNELRRQRSTALDFAHVEIAATHKYVNLQELLDNLNYIKRSLEGDGGDPTRMFVAVEDEEPGLVILADGWIEQRGGNR